MRYWSATRDTLLSDLRTRLTGLTSSEVSDRTSRFALGHPKHRRYQVLRLLLSQFKSPITIILIFAAALSSGLSDPIDAVIILTIIIVSAILGFWQEYSAAGALQKLLALVSTQCTVLRDGMHQSIPFDHVVPGDIVLFTAGDAIPADCRLLESKDLFVDEASLTGETFPVDKQVGVVEENTPLAKRVNSLFMGTHVVSGTGIAVVALTGDATEFGKISERLELRPPETDFERGVRLFGYFLLEITLLLVVAIFAINVYFHRPVLEAFLFSLALAVGLTPQLLPAIISVNLSHGARRMAQRSVIVRRLSSIENFGSMNVLCSDKTGTITQGIVRIHSAVDAWGAASDKVMELAFINAKFESGFANPIDVAIREAKGFDLDSYKKLDESPYDFVRKRLSVLVASQGASLLVTKGAVENILEVCNQVQQADGTMVSLEQCRDDIHQRYAEFGDQGFRTLGIAWRDMGASQVANKDAEEQMIFAGFLVLHDPPKENIAETIDSLRGLGVSLKMITGDNRRVAASIAKQVGLSGQQIISGSELRQMSDEALMHRVNATEVFAEVEPNQKERIILACQKAGNVVGYMGDGINDATALHAADVGISVDQAVDVAKEAADIVLLKRDLAVLIEGVREGRRTFANTMKYVFMATSANFGNMFSMAGASLFLNFLPLLPKQILLINLLTDLPELTIAGDHVDEEMIRQPQRWDIGFIRRFMLVFGTLSSVFDFLTFGVLWWLLKADESQFRTGWFLESVLSASLVVLIVRTPRPILRSLPGRWLLIATVISAAITIALPWTPIASLLGFTPLPWRFLLAVGLIVVAYVFSAEFAKAAFYRWRNDERWPLA